jgi:hypothetical protein
VYEIVTSYGGAIDVTSRLGAGSNFEVWLPLAKPDGECTTGRKVKQRPGGGEAVVIINEDAGRLLHDEEIVAALGYEPVGYLHLEQALDAFRSEPQRFDIILIANVSSVARALAFATDLHAELPWVPILLAAPHGGLTADLLAAAGIYEVVKTPVTSADLASVLPKLLSRQPS